MLPEIMMNRVTVSKKKILKNFASERFGSCLHEHVINCEVDHLLAIASLQLS